MTTASLGKDTDPSRQLQIPGVWVWQKGQLSLHQRLACSYVEIKQVHRLPMLDMALLTC